MFALRCNAGLRMLSGFLTMYMAFLLTQHPLPGFEDRRTLLLALVIGAAGLGNAVGIGLGSLLRKVNPVLTVVFALLVDAAMALVCAVFYGLLTAVLLGLTAGVAQALGKLSLDSLIQRDVPERVRTAGFARSETLLQLSWVVGGFIGIALPLVPALGLGVLAALMVAVDGVRRAQPAAGGHRVGLSTAATGEAGRGSAQSSSSSARPRRSFAVGFAVRASGWRPWR